jgi:8-oxo-dGTP diphosphatase
MSDSPFGAPTFVRDDPVRVLAAVIRRGERYLICKRPAGKRHAGAWEFPGGKLLPGESLHDAAVREIAEELGTRVTGVGEVLFERRDEGSVFVIAFVPVSMAGVPRALEHVEIRWAGVGEIADMELAPVDRLFFEACLR